MLVQAQRKISAAKPSGLVKVSFFFGKEADPNILRYFINMATQLQQFFPGGQIIANFLTAIAQ